MKERTFTLAGRTVGRIGYGAMQLPGPGVFGPPRDRGEALAVLRRAAERGVDHIDTAQFYGPDVANELIHEALAPYPDQLVIATKIGAVRDGAGGWPAAQQPKQLREQVEHNLTTLGLECLDVVNLRRRPDEDDPPAQRIHLDDQMAEMVALRDEGKVGAIGISTAALSEVEHVSAEITCVQNAYSLLDRRDDGVLEFCRRAEIAYVPTSP